MDFIKDEEQASYVDAALEILASGEVLDLIKVTGDLGLPKDLARELQRHFIEKGYVKENEKERSAYLINREGIEFCKKKSYNEPQKGREGKSKDKVKIVSDADINADSIAFAMRGASIKTKQFAISIPKVKKFFNLYKEGKKLSAIQVCQETNTIVDGNHRYVAGRLYGIEVEMKPAGISENWKRRPVIDWEKVRCDDSDWGV